MLHVYLYVYICLYKEFNFNNNQPNKTPTASFAVVQERYANYLQLCWACLSNKQRIYSDIYCNIQRCSEVFFIFHLVNNW